MRKFVKSVSGLFLLISILLCVVIGFYTVKLPDKYYLGENNSFNIKTFFNVSAVSAEKTRQVYLPYGEKRESNQVDLKLFGVIPIKRVTAEKIDRPTLIPLGVPFGIKIITSGTMVTSFGNVESGENSFSPASEAGIKIGDIVMKVNGMDIAKNNDVSVAVQLNGEKTEVLLIRNGEEMTVTVIPVKSAKDGLYKIGMWVRDSSAGIGTMTYYNPESSVFAGLGHAVCDVDTGQMLPLLKGEAVSVSISDVVKGHSGAPGELCGGFLSRIPIGLIESNTEAGVFGHMECPPALGGEIPLAYKQEVEIGKAKLITTTDGNEPAEYDVLIEKIDYNDKNKVKNMVVKVTDKKLLGKAGGIVQGMSGSPIIQNGRLVAAVTHVFVSDPTRGYAIFAENMYREALSCTELDDNLENAA